MQRSHSPKENSLRTASFNLLQLAENLRVFRLHWNSSRRDAAIVGTNKLQYRCHVLELAVLCQAVEQVIYCVICAMVGRLFAALNKAHKQQ